MPFVQGLLAEIEVQGDAEGALTRIHEALALAGKTEEHWSDAFLHRCRGEILPKRDPAKHSKKDPARPTRAKANRPDFTPTAPELEALLTRSQTAEALVKAGFPVSAKTLATKASRGGGPP